MVSAWTTGGFFSVTSPFGLLITRPAAASSKARRGRTRKVMSRPACSILPPKYPPMAPAPTMRTRISQFLLLLDTGLSRTLLIRGSRDIYIPEGALCALAGIGLRRRLSSRNSMLDIEECERARVRRDRRFDGLFFSGVRTTRIYCRPVCPVRPAKAANVMFYPSAAAAELAGFRPCLRCRPEAAPFSPAWKGTRTTVERALRLIADGALDDGSVETLADRLGIGSRHLSRLFQMHLGATPVQVAQTTRVQPAKRFLDETDLTMSEIAVRAGFGSLRRFNTVFAEVYRRPPTQIGRARKPSAT